MGNRLAGPANKDFPVVFEAGVNFGRATKGNYYMFRPKLSLENAGITFAFTSDQFKPEAKVLALALTYDVNAFVSTGLGGNFSQYQNPQLYCSIGINKMAFEAFLKGVRTIVK